MIPTRGRIGDVHKGWGDFTQIMIKKETTDSLPLVNKRGKRVEKGIREENVGKRDARGVLGMWRRLRQGRGFHSLGRGGNGKIGGITQSREGQKGERPKLTMSGDAGKNEYKGKQGALAVLEIT